MAWLGQVVAMPPSLGFMRLKSATGLVTPLTALIKDSVGLLLLKGKVTWELGARHLIGTKIALFLLKLKIVS